MKRARAGAFTPGGHASSASRRGERARAPARRGRPATPRFVTRFVARFSTRKQPLSARRTCLVDTAFTPHSRRNAPPRAADPGQFGLQGPVS
ncbi:transporter, basic amino acid/polyamine antiporter (APA) family domain protein [Burkholderia pseudomallei]|nr:transporter, basic amino acid/polyamine antiporter (APA) family domain protein [Burkholderia pseudomallei]